MVLFPHTLLVVLGLNQGSSTEPHLPASVLQSFPGDGNPPTVQVELISDIGTAFWSLRN